MRPTNASSFPGPARALPPARSTPATRPIPPDRPTLALASLPTATRLSLIGPWQLLRGGRVVEVGSNAQRLLAILAVRGPRERAYLAGVMWPDCREPLALGNLRATLSRLHRRGMADLLCCSGGALALAESVELDLRDLEMTAAGVLDGRLPTSCWRTVQILASGDLLPGWYDDWVTHDRERLRQLRLHALEALSAHLVLAGNIPAAVEAGLAAVAVDPLRESAHRVLIGAYLAEGNLAEAVRQFERVRRVLNQELGVEPTAQTVALLHPAGRMNATHSSEEQADAGLRGRGHAAARPGRVR